MLFARPTRALGLMGLFAAAALCGNDANAQQIYRIVQPDGRVTFTDRRPTEPTAKASAAPVASAGANSQASLPFELRETANRFPVTLYTAPSCTPCTMGRAMLSGRGIPFTEKTVVSSDDIEALKRLAGTSSLPFLTIGGQQLKGFSDGEWGEFLDAAGYPRTSKLPAGYTQAPATPLVTTQQAQAPARPAARQDGERGAGSEPPPAAEDNPAGIRF